MWNLEERRLHAVVKDAHDAPVVSGRIIVLHFLWNLEGRRLHAVVKDAHDAPVVSGRIIELCSLMVWN